MRIRIAVPDGHVTPALLNAALEATTLANESLLQNGATPIHELIKRGKVKWKPEPFKDGEHFDLTTTVANRGWGDCDDLAPAHAAYLRASGKDPGARAVVKRSGPKRWHAIVQKGSGEFVDPSAAAGMREYQRKHGHKFVPGIVGAVMPTMAERCALGLKRAGRLWAARCDLPTMRGGAAVCGVALRSELVDALEDAINGATVVGEASGLVDPYDVTRAIALQGTLCGDSLQEIREDISGEDMSDGELVGFFGSILKAAKGALPFAKHLPIPGAAAMADLAQGALKGGGKRSGAVAAPSPNIAAQMPREGGSGPSVAYPQGQTGTAGPIIIRF